MQQPSRRMDSTQESAPIVWSASASNVPTDSPPPATEARPRQEDFFPAPFHLPLERPEPPEAPEKGALLLWSLFLRPDWEEDEEGDDEASCCDRGTTGETPPRSAEEADEDPALDGPAESSEDATSAEQERRSKPRTSWSGQGQAKGQEKYQKTREGQHNASMRPVQPGP